MVYQLPPALSIKNLDELPSSINPSGDDLSSKPKRTPSIDSDDHLDNFDDILEYYVHSFGKYQLVQFLLLCIPTITVAMHVMSWTFVSLEIQESSIQNSTNTTEDDTNFSIGFKQDMNGKNSWMKATVQSLYYIGQMTGSYFCGVMGDKIGRKKVFYIAIVIQSLCGLLLCVAPNWWLFAILKAGTGFSQPGIFGVAVVLGTELVGRRYRALGSVAAGSFYAFGEIILAGLAYLIHDYRLLHLIISLPSILFLSYWWLIPESARWLISENRFQEADRILNKAAKMNGSHIPENWWRKMESCAANKTSNSFSTLDLLRTREMRKRTLTCFFIWPVSTMMYYGLTMKSDIGGGNLYVNFALSGLMEIPSMILVYCLIDKVGRKPLVSMGLLTAGLCLIVNWIVGDSIPTYAAVMQTMIAKGAITVAYTVMYTYTTELFPTILRNTAVGCCSTVARIGAITSSCVALWLVDTYGKLTMVIPFCILAILAAAACQLLLPETNGKKLPESISEVEGNHI
ncbi:unnamed protein product [Auanema sp. JU1783]|nr:unnamed protein product [Auanema sp. JU1783]